MINQPANQQIPSNQELLNSFEIIVCPEPEVGLEPEVVAQLIAKSREENISESVPNDRFERFRDVESYRSWSSKGKLIFALLSAEDLAGIIWFSKKNPPIDIDADTTFAIRLYSGYRGRSLAKPFMSLAHYVLPTFTDRPVKTWLETDETNIGAQRLYSSFGYEVVGNSDAGRVVMAYTVSNE